MYRLLDFGDSRKLEQFGAVVLDRPCPAAEEFCKASPELWRKADANENSSATWSVSFPLEASNEADTPPVSLELQLKITPFGHVGVFPEQLNHWRWLYRCATRSIEPRRSTAPGTTAPGTNSCEPTRRLKALNLFAYTGGSTLALVLGGAEVVHVDAAAPSVTWARSNAALNQLQSQPIRWIVEDARKFVQREIRRGSHYDIVVLDPPSYGHGPTGKAWDLAAEWAELLTGCLRLVKQSPRAKLLWTGHSAVPAVEDIIDCISSDGSWQIEMGRNRLTDMLGRTLDAGYFVRAISGTH